MRPIRAEERTAARQRGGQQSSTAARLAALVPERLTTTYDLLEQALGELHRGELDPRIASAMGVIARAMIAVIQAGEMELRLRALEEGQKNV